jgi:UDP-2,3-diacylglucosamine pyrophosphatase LpxH
MNTPSKCTAIISDLHLCEAEPVNLKYPLWKKYKTKQFFFDDVINHFLLHLETLSQGKKIELVLNGDIFDFDSVMYRPEDPIFHVHWIEKKRGLFPREARSLIKIQKIIEDHWVFFEGLANFVKKGHELIFIIGNHDVELHFDSVQLEILNALGIKNREHANVRFNEWFYLSEKDTLIEHGNQYDPYCVFEDPINPFSRGYNYITMKLPFGNQACRYILNGLGFFNPHVDSNFIMSLKDYVNIFLRYMVKAQPLLILDWFGGALATLYFSIKDKTLRPVRNPLKIEDRVEEIAQKAKVDARVVRELKELFVDSATNFPLLVMKELWLDRAFLLLISFLIILQLFTIMNAAFGISILWGIIPFFIMLPFFLFYSKSIISNVSSYKEPDEHILSTASAITGALRIVYGHTHIPRHEMIGPVEHLNSGCWSAAFLDLECTQPVDQRTFVWIEPKESASELMNEVQSRKAELRKFMTTGSEVVRNTKAK